MNSKVIICYVAYGRKLEICQQLYFSILSLLKYDTNKFDIHILTDSPEHFSRLSKYCIIHMITAQNISDWKGQYDYHFRIKLKALTLLTERYPENDILFVDTDTFHYAAPDPLITLLQQGVAVFHCNEGKLVKNRDNSLWAPLKYKEFSGIEINHNTYMFNSGVIGLPASKAKEILQHAINVCDQMCPELKIKGVVEQLAISVVAQGKLDYQFADKSILHYWGNKSQWNELIRAHMAEVFLKDYDITNELSLLDNFDPIKIPIYKRTQINNQRLKFLADVMFPKIRAKYFSPLK
ncbi:hypothetical protein [Shewanella dokdonensis]|uniref:Nucleotide-diphospho-sugar transferase domain-containing protein n=1 Tax=Shewanella dokdonensis TaxID=712036 RepID=A0ABX8DBZ4_9GAMM|nr:hypothetical protein [Shewanella dokdonensis]MCL1074718.1 hypothetical protein [Shewanella dokdonensis]QVK22305.1 hypothetical protein KHX94_12880 [Shewanella dokdonensis]